MSQSKEPVASAGELDQGVFRNVAGHFASGVTIITTESDSGLFGTTASAVASLSMDPPMMLVCLNRSSSTHDAIRERGRFAVNILALEQRDFATRFATKSADKFRDVPYIRSERGLPLIEGALASIECRVADTAPGGTHTVFIGEVLDAQSRPGEPLAYYRGQFGSLERILEASSYESVRELVLRRHTALGEEIRIDDFARELRTESALVYNSLVRLLAEGLVSRLEEGVFTPTPVTEEFVDDFYGARQTIEVGVLDAYLRDASDDRVLDIVRRGRALANSETGTPDGLDAFLRDNIEFHAAIVSLAGSRQLELQFRQLSLATVWRETYQSPLWRNQAGHPLIQRLAVAIENRDADTACELVRTQVSFVTDAAKELIRLGGGVL